MFNFVSIVLEAEMKQRHKRELPNNEYKLPALQDTAVGKWEKQTILQFGWINHSLQYSICKTQRLWLFPLPAEFWWFKITAVLLHPRAQ